MKHVAEKLNYLKMTLEENYDLLNYKKQVCSDTESIEDALDEGIEKGIAQGKAEVTQKIVLNMLKENCDLKLIAQISNMPLEHIELLKSEALNRRK